MAKSNLLKEIKRLEGLKRRAIKQLLSAKSRIESQLEELGADASAIVAAVKKARRRRRRDPNKVCKVCGKKGHDARRHRYEKANKKASATA